jgi:hypothetical protein
VPSFKPLTRFQDTGVPLQGTGGAYGQSGSVFVLDGVTLVDDGNTETLSPGRNEEPNWDAIPKDVKIYMMDYMSIQDYARISQTSKAWNRAAKKHRYAVDAAERERHHSEMKRNAKAAER